MKRSAIIMAAFFLVIALSDQAAAQVPGRAGRGPMGIGQWNAPPDIQAAPRRGLFNNMPTEKREELEKLRKAFLDNTVDLRNDIRTRRTELDNLLRTNNPDVTKAKAIQKEISDLQAELAQKTLELRLEMLKVYPDARYGMGFGRNMMRFGPGM